MDGSVISLVRPPQSLLPYFWKEHEYIIAEYISRSQRGMGRGAGFFDSLSRFQVQIPEHALAIHLDSPAERDASLWTSAYLFAYELYSANKSVMAGFYINNRSTLLDGKVDSRRVVKAIARLLASLTLNLASCVREDLANLIVFFTRAVND